MNKKVIDVSKNFKVGSGEFVEFERKESNLRKFNLYRNYYGDDSEGVWCWLSDDDIVKYDNDAISGEYVYVICANATLNGVPWGAVIPVKLNGGSRPYCVMAEFIDLSSNIVFTAGIKKERDEAAKNVPVVAGATIVE